MRVQELPVGKLFAVAAGLMLALLLAGCTVHEEKSASTGEKKVDIKTPFGSIKVNTDVDAQATGLPLYPGARRKQDEGDREDKHSANVNIDSSFFGGVKVVALQFESDDAPDKVVAFYRDKIKSFGPMIECKDTVFGRYSRSSNSDELKCDSGHGDSIELKAGSKDNQHIVAVKPHGKGSEFALVYVSTHGTEGTL